VSVKCQGQDCAHDAFGYVEVGVGDGLVIGLCERCANEMYRVATTLGLRFDAFDPGKPLPPRSDTQRGEQRDRAGDMHLIAGRLQIYDGESFEFNPYTEEAALACCDCGLVHIVGARLLDYSRTLRITMRRDKALTEEWRKLREQRTTTTNGPAQEEARPRQPARSAPLEEP